MALKATFDADFGSFINELSKAEVKLRGFEPTIDKVGSRLQKFADSLDGNRLFTNAGIAAAGIEKIGGAANLSAAEVAKFGRQFDEAATKARAMGVSLGTSFDRVHADLQQARAGIGAMATAADSATQRFGAMGQAVMQGLGIGVGLGAAGVVAELAGAVKQQATDVLVLGDAYARLQKGFTALQGGGDQARATLDGLRTATRGLVADTDLMLASNQATVLGLKSLGVDMNELAEIAARVGAALGKDATQSIEQFALALAKGSTERLDELGIVLKLNEAYDQYASRLGKTAAALTDTEKKQAFALIGLEKGREVLTKLGADTLTAGQQVDRLGVAFDNLKAQIGSGGPGGGVIATGIGAVADAVTDLARSIEEAKRALGDLGTLIPGAGTAANGIGSLVGGVLNASVAPGVRMAARGLIQQRDNLQRVGALPIDLPAPTTGTVRDADGTTQRAAAPVSLPSVARPGARTSFTEKEIDFAQRQVDAALDRVVQQNTRIATVAKERQRRLDELTGRTRLGGALQTVDDIFGASGVGLGALSSDSVLKVFDSLIDARTIATRLQPKAVAGLTGALDKLATHPAVVASTREASQKLVDRLFDPASLKTSARSWAGKLGDEMFRIPGVTDQDVIASSTPMNWTYLRAGVEPIEKADKATRDWAKSLSSVTQAFAQLSQIAGGAFGTASRTIGSLFGAANAALETVKALGQEFSSLLDKDGKNGLSKTGAALAGGLAGIGVGTQLGGLFTNRGAGFASGAGGGALAGGMATGWNPIGIGVGALVGGFAGMWTAASNAKAQRRAKDVSADQLSAQFGGLDKLLDTVGGLGLNQQSFLQRFYGSPKEFGQAVVELNAALEKERLEAERLATSLGAVARIQGVISRQDLASLATARPGSQAESLAKEFLAQQRSQAASGLTRAIGGLTRMMAISDEERAQLLAGISDKTEQTRVIDARLNEKATQVVTNFGASVRAASAGLFALFDDAIRRGESAVSALEGLREPMAQLEEIYRRSGVTPGAGFAQMQSLMSIVNGADSGPAVQIGAGLGSALSGLQNTGLLSPELFQEISAGIAESYYNLERMGKGGLDAARILQPGLQTIWQLQQDFGYEVDESTQKLLDFAESSGLIGDKFRPAEERMAAGIDRLVELFEGMTQGFGETFASDAQEGAEVASRNILDVFSRLKPKVTVEYVYKQPTDDDVFGRSQGGGPSRTTSTDTTRTATTQTTGGGVYLDGQQVGYHTARYIDGVANWIGA